MKEKRMFRKSGFIALLLGALCLWMPGSPFQAGDVLSRTAGPITLVKARNVYYDNTIKGIIRNDCGRCHSGPSRNLTDYDSLKAYADGGLLSTMVQGPMRRFAGNDVQTIVDWVQQGAPEKPAAKAAAFFHGPGPGPRPPLQQAPGGRFTYDNTVKHILARDCLRCHSGPFRNLTTYEHLKMYVDNGLLQTLVMPGGPMHRFAGPDTRLIMAWI
ncbi:MAG: hypothetical protein ABII06_20795, partial [Pseudomonadota bacterium]